MVGCQGKRAIRCDDGSGQGRSLGHAQALQQLVEPWIGADLVESRLDLQVSQLAIAIVKGLLSQTTV